MISTSLTWDTLSPAKVTRSPFKQPSPYETTNTRAIYRHRIHERTTTGRADAIRKNTEKVKVSALQKHPQRAKPEPKEKRRQKKTQDAPKTQKEK
jgi:hypothetical protein